MLLIIQYLFRNVNNFIMDFVPFLWIFCTILCFDIKNDIFNKNREIKEEPQSVLLQFPDTYGYAIIIQYQYTC